MSKPINFRFDGYRMLPVDLDACRQVYQAGKTYRLKEHAERTGKSHRHYFACVKTAWQNLPEKLTPRFPSPEHLRKYALIKSGYCDHRTVVCNTKEDALQLLAVVEALDEYAVCSVQAQVVSIWTPASQSMAAMGKAEFETSKHKVLEYLAHLIGITVDELAAVAGREV